MLGKLHEADPRDRDVAYALSDVLMGRGLDKLTPPGCWKRPKLGGRRIRG